MPFVAVLLGLLGLVPFIICGLGALTANPLLAGRMLSALNDYAALILAFLGAVHWGLGLAAVPAAARSAHRTRITLSTAPLLLAWVALLLPLMGGADWSPLVLLIPGFILVLLVERHATKRGLLPPAYMGLRWIATTGAVLVMTAVLVYRLLGHTVVF